jgi:glycosyltransferase involved in cell wall biosynthesis
MSDIKITVAIPVYNREDCIAKCIESVLQQTVLPFEIVVVDDGSTDNTRNVIESLLADHPQINFFPAPKNGGENYARNRCVEQATGEFIFWLDSDDYIVPDAIESVLAAMNKNPGFLHYMFLTSDRQTEFSGSTAFSKKKHVTTFNDWVTSAVSGDFAHVMHKSVFEGLPFFEDIRGFPGINFLRIHRKTKQQLFVNKLVTIRDRNRADALSLTGYLSNRKSIWEQFVNTNYFLQTISLSILRMTFWRLIKKCLFVKPKRMYCLE